jgi:hypothetical protein
MRELHTEQYFIFNVCAPEELEAAFIEMGTVLGTVRMWNIWLVITSPESKVLYHASRASSGGRGIRRPTFRRRFLDVFRSYSRLILCSACFRTHFY